MSFTLSSGPLREEEINLSHTQIQKVERFKFEKVENLTNQWIGYRDENITEEIRDYLLAHSVLEVDALVKYSKNGGFARYFVYINNKLHDLYKSMRDAVTDPAIRNVEWAQMTSALLVGDWQLFVSFVAMHEQELQSIAGHIVNVGRSLVSVVEEIISMVANRIKEIFMGSLETIKRYALPATLVALTCAIGAAMTLPAVGQFLLTISPYGVLGIGVVLGNVLNVALKEAFYSFKEARQESKRESSLIERVGLRKARDCIQGILQEIEDRKYWEEDHDGSVRVYIGPCRKISLLKREIDNLIGHI